MASYTRPMRFVVLGGLALLPSCAPSAGDMSRDSSKPGQVSAETVAQMPVEPNINAVGAFYDANRPWLASPDQSKILGIKVGALYLFGPQSLGVFGEGVIRPRLYRLERNADGSNNPVLAKEWAFDIRDAIPLRAKKRTAMGWGYALFLDWGDLDLAGKEIRVIINFERADGHVIQSDKKDFRVPLRAS